jgi:hypothetical protein
MCDTGNLPPIQNLDRNCMYVTYRKNSGTEMWQNMNERYSVTFPVGVLYPTRKHGLQNEFIDND